MISKKCKLITWMLISFCFIFDNTSFAENSQNNTQMLLQQAQALEQSTIPNNSLQNSNKSSNLLPNMPSTNNLPNNSNNSFHVPSAVPINSSANSQSQISSQSPVQQQQPKTTASIPNNNSSFAAPFTSALPQNNSELQSVSDGAFNGAVQTILPMTPLQIHRLRQLYSASQYAAAAPAGIPPRPTATSLFVDLSPGATPPAINLEEGNITALDFLDSTGGPWPIQAIANGNPSAFKIEWNKKDNVLLVQALSAFGRGNLAVRLRGLGPPVMISMFTNSTLQGQGGMVDYRVDLRIPGFGPNANPVAGSNLPNSANSILLDVLDGIPPDGSKALDITDNAGQVWLKGDSIFLRTRLTLLSPAWTAIMSSADGTNAYQLQKTPLLLMSQNGKVIQVKIKGF